MQLTDFTPIEVPDFCRRQGIVAAFKSQHYNVSMINFYCRGNKYRKLVVSAADYRKLDNHWRVLQDIKNLFWGDDAAAIEIYPPEADLVDIANCYHLMEIDLSKLESVLRPTPDTSSHAITE